MDESVFSKYYPVNMSFSVKLFPWYVSPGSGKLFDRKWKLLPEEAWVVLSLGHISAANHKFRFEINEMFNYLTGRDPNKVPLAEIRELFENMESGINKCNHVAQECGGVSFKIDWGRTNGKIQRHNMVRGEVINMPIKGTGGFASFSAVEIAVLFNAFEDQKYKLNKGVWMMFYLKSQNLRLGDPTQEYYVVGYAGGSSSLADKLGVAYQTCKSYLRSLLQSKLITLALADHNKANVYLVGISPDTDKWLVDIQHYGVISYRATKIGGRPTTKKEGEQDTFVV